MTIDEFNYRREGEGNYRLLVFSLFDITDKGFTSREKRDEWADWFEQSGYFVSKYFFDDSEKGVDNEISLSF